MPFQSLPWRPPLFTLPCRSTGKGQHPGHATLSMVSPWPWPEKKVDAPVGDPGYAFLLGSQQCKVALQHVMVSDPQVDCVLDLQHPGPHVPVISSHKVELI